MIWSCSPTTIKYFFKVRSVSSEETRPSICSYDFRWRIAWFLSISFDKRSNLYFLLSLGISTWCTFLNDINLLETTFGGLGRLSMGTKMPLYMWLSLFSFFLHLRYCRVKEWQCFYGAWTWMLSSFNLIQFLGLILFFSFRKQINLHISNMNLFESILALIFVI